MDFRKVRIAAGTVLTIGLVFSIWYKVTYSMDEVTPYEINPNIGEYSVLIATQGSNFKNAIVSEVTERLDLRNVYFRITDVEELYEVSPEKWDAIVILHTWEMNRPPASVKVFLQGNPTMEKIIVLATSGEGTQSIKGVDSITSESEIEEVPKISEKITGDIERILQDMH